MFSLMPDLQVMDYFHKLMMVICWIGEPDVIMASSQLIPY